MADAVTDPSDWASTALPELSHIDAALRCQICKDLYTSAMATECAHTFCSLCIRRYLNSHQHCPLCRKTQQEMQLKKNGALQEAVDAFRDARTKVYEKAKVLAVPSVEETPRSTPYEEPASSQRATRSSTRLQRSTRSKGTNYADAVALTDDKNDGDFVEEPTSTPDDGCVPCPICSRRIPIPKANSHAARCLDGIASPSSPPRSTKPAFSLSQPSSSSSQRPTRNSAAPPDLKPLPKITYSLLRESQLREKLRALGIPSDGPKRLLQERHTEWLNIWNANVDSDRPRSKRELLRDLRIWETAHLRPTNNKTKEKSWDDKNWANKHQDEFADLVAQARESARNKRRKVEEERDMKEDKSDEKEGQAESDVEGKKQEEAPAKEISAIEVRDEPRIAAADHEMALDDRPASQPTPLHGVEVSPRISPSTAPPAEPSQAEKRKYSAIESPTAPVS